MDYAKLPKVDLNAILCDACYSGDLKLIKEIFASTEAKKCNNIIPKNMLLIATERGHIDIIKYMVESQELNNILSVKFKKYLLKDIFKEACSKGQLEIVDYIFNLEGLNLANKSQVTRGAFTEACKGGHLAVVDYLLKKDELNFKDDFPAFEHAVFFAVIGSHLHLLKYFFESMPQFALKALKNSTILFAAESKGKIDVVKYLLTSPDFKDKIDLHEDHDIIYKCAHNGNMTNILRYLIVDLNIEKTKDIEVHLKKFPNPEIEEMFVFHDLVNNLQTNLTKTKKPKV
jgi:ankyrin repeat protein